MRQRLLILYTAAALLAANTAIAEETKRPAECERSLTAACAMAEATLASRTQGPFAVDAAMPAKLAEGWLALGMPEKALASLSGLGTASPEGIIAQSRIAAHYWQHGERQKADRIWAQQAKHLPTIAATDCEGRTSATLTLWEEKTHAQPAYLVQLPASLKQTERDIIRWHYATTARNIPFPIASGLVDIIAYPRLQTEAMLAVASNQTGKVTDETLQSWLATRQQHPDIKHFLSIRLPVLLAQKGELESAIAVLHKVDDIGAKSLGWLALAEHYLSVDQKNLAARMLTFAIDLESSLPLEDKPSTLALEAGIFEGLGRKEIASDKMLQSALHLQHLAPRPDALLIAMEKASSALAEHWPAGHTAWMSKIWQSSIPTTMAGWEGAHLATAQQTLLRGMERDRGHTTPRHQLDAVAAIIKLNNSTLREALLMALADQPLLAAAGSFDEERADQIMRALTHHPEGVEAGAAYIALSRAAHAAKNDKWSKLTLSASESMLNGRPITLHSAEEMEIRRNRLKLSHALLLMEIGKVDAGVSLWASIKPQPPMPPRGVDAMLKHQNWQAAWQHASPALLAASLQRTGVLEGMLGYLTLKNSSDTMPVLFKAQVELESWDEADRTLKAIRDWDEHSWLFWRRVLPRADDALNASLARLHIAKKRPKQAQPIIQKITTPAMRAELWLQLAKSLSGKPPVTPAPIAPQWLLRQLCPAHASITPPGMGK